MSKEDNLNGNPSLEELKKRFNNTMIILQSVNGLSKDQLEVLINEVNNSDIEHKSDAVKVVTSAWNFVTQRKKERIKEIG